MSFLADPVPGSPHRPSSRTSPAGLPRICPLYGPREKETLFADGRLNALAICLLEGLGLRHAVVGVLSAMEATDDPKEELAVRAVENSEVRHAESPPATHLFRQQRLHRLGL